MKNGLKEKQAEKRKIKLENYNVLCSKMNANGYKAVNAVYSNGKASFLGICCAAPFVLVLSVCYWLFAHGNSLWAASSNLPYKWFVFAIVFFMSIPVHEVLHGIGWCFAGKVKWSNIHITMESDMPLCHCDLPLQGGKYLVGALLPVFVLGFIPAVISFIIFEKLLILFSVLNITIAGGDLLLALRVRKHSNDMIIDHPTEAGFVAFTK